MCIRDREIVTQIKQKNGKFITLIHPTAIVAKTAVIGEGNILDPFTIVGPNVHLGNFNLLTSQTIISHDCNVGDFNFFATSLLCGHCLLYTSLKVIYDAAHAFGVEMNGKSILEAGDMSTLSFHATKVYNTVEGGALVCQDAQTKKRIDYLKNFGFAGETTVIAPGINGKIDEIRSAYGLLNLKQVDTAIEARHQVAIKYREVSVSYTHLDVYKRQMLKSKRCWTQPHL